MTIRLTFGRLRRMLAEAMSDDQARRRELRHDPQSMDVEDALDEFMSMLGPEVSVEQQSVNSVKVSMTGPGARQELEDEVSYVLVDELGYTYDGVDGLYRRVNLVIETFRDPAHGSSDDFGLELQFVDDSPGDAPVEIDAATLAAISPAAWNALEKGCSEDECDPEEKVFWTVSSPNDTNEAELRPWLKRDWEKLVVSRGGQDVVLFYGDAVDDESGNMWVEADQEWANYVF